MPSYSFLSTKLYNENIQTGLENFICKPTIFLCDELRAQIFKLIIDHKDNRNLTQYLTWLEERPFNEKYLFIIGLILSIPDDRDPEQVENNYWNNFVTNLSIDTTINQGVRDKILNLIARFCKAHCIPFFDVYQNRNQCNICSRIYSLMPFTKSELLAIAYISKTEEISGQSDFILFKELAVTSYSTLFGRANLEALKNGNEIIEQLTNKDVLPRPFYSFNLLFSEYIEKYWYNLKEYVLTEVAIQRLVENLKTSSIRSIHLQDFYIYFNLLEKQLYLQPRGRLLGEIEFIRMPVSIKDIRSSKKLEYKFQGGVRTLAFLLTRKYLVTDNSRNNGWLQIEVDYNKRIYKKEIVGLAERKDEELVFLPVNFDQVDNNITSLYLNIQGSSSLEFSGGLAYHYASYMWFAIPDIIVHNDGVENIKMKLNDQDIPNNQATTLKEKFYRYLTNKQKLGFYPLGGHNEGECNTLSFYDNKGCFLDSIKIERQNYHVEKECNKLEFNGYSVERSTDVIIPCVNYDATIFDFSHKREYLLFWLSRFEERGVTYERLKNAIVTVYDDQLGIGNSLTRNLSTLIKRVIEQFIGLGFIRLKASANETRYIINRARFVSTHRGQLLYTGARSYQQMKEIFACDCGKRGLKIDTPFRLFDSIDLPSLIKYNTDSNGLIGMDQNVVVSRFIKDRLDINKTDVRKSNIQSFPLYLLHTYELCQNSIACTNPSLTTNLNKFKVFNLNSLNFNKVENIKSVQAGAVLQVEEFGLSQRYLAGEKSERDGESAIQLFKVLPGKLNDALYYFEPNAPNRYMGWMYDESKQRLYIPRRINVPHKIRQALQCCVGTYTNTYFTKIQEPNSSIPRTENGNLQLSKENAIGSIEVEEFLGITEKFLGEVEQKLNTKAKLISAECSHH